MLSSSFGDGSWMLHSVVLYISSDLYGSSFESRAFCSQFLNMSTYLSAKPLPSC